MAMRDPGGQGGRHRRNWRWSTAPACIAGNGDAAARRAREEKLGLATRPVSRIDLLYVVARYNIQPTTPIH